MQAELYIQLSKHDGRLAHPQPWGGLLDLGTNMVDSQYHGCWCPGDVRSQDIGSCVIGIVNPR